MAAGADAGYSMLSDECGKRRTSWSKWLAWPAACLLLCAASFALGVHSVQEEPTPPSPESAAAAGAPAQHGLWNPKISPVFDGEPLAKGLIRRFDMYLMLGAAFDQGEAKLRTVSQWLAPEFTYDTVGFPNSYSLRGWTLSGEESQFRTAFPASSFSQMLFFGSDEFATTTSYGNVLWQGELFGIPPTHEWTYFRVTDFYRIRKTGPKKGLVSYNFMMIDWADFLRRVGRPVLPPAPLHEGLVMTSHADDGVPAPLSVVAAGRDPVAAKKAMVGALYGGWAGDVPAAKWWHRNMTFYGPGGIGLAKGTQEFQRHVLDPYHAAFSNRSVEEKMLFCEGNYCGAYGYLWGDHVGTWVGLSASGKRVGLRFCMHFRVVGGMVQEGWAIVDFPGLFKQLGLDFFGRARDQTRVLS